jgi:hypothetical protein
MLTYTTMKGGVLAVDHLRTLVFGVVIAEALYLTLTSLLTSCSTHGSRFCRILRTVYLLMTSGKSRDQ